MVTLVVRCSLRVLCLMVLLLGPSRVARADAWKQIGPDGGTVGPVAIDPVTPSTVYAGTDGGVFKSTDGGISWGLVGLAGTRVPALAVDPSAPAHIFASSWAGWTQEQPVQGYIYQSTDGGITWMKSVGPDFVSYIVIDAARSTVYASGGCLFKSADNGVTWQKITCWLGGSFAFDPLSPSTAYAVSTQGEGLYKTTDGGVNWHNVSLQQETTLAVDPVNPSTVYYGPSKSTDGGSTWSSLGITSPIAVFAIAPESPATLYAGTRGGGLLKSSDAGATWSSVSSANVTSVAIASSQATTMYAGVAWPDIGGVLKSMDAGDSWTGPNALHLASLQVLRVAVDPLTPTTLYSCTDRALFKTTDGGTSWSSILDLSGGGYGFVIIDPSNPASLYAGMGGRSWKSTDAGADWTSIPVPGYLLAIDPQSPSTLYAAFPGLSRSTDGGATWTTMNATVPSNAITLAVDPVTLGTLYAANDKGGIYGGLLKSTDAGVTWTAVNHGLPQTAASPPIFISAITIAPSGTLYVGEWGRGLFRSTDAGASWAPINRGLPVNRFSGHDAGAFTSIAVDALDPSSVYAGIEDAGVFRSTDGGDSWTAFNAGLLDLRDPWVTVSAQPAGSTLYVGTEGSSTFKRSGGCAADADCDDANDCTTDVCDLASGTCSHTVVADGAACADGVTCTTVGTCSSGVCVAERPDLTSCSDDLIVGPRPGPRACAQEWFAVPPPPSGYGAPNKYTCMDDDPSCDFGTLGDHACTFRLAMCFNIAETRFSCTPTDVARVQMLQPSSNSRDPVQLANRKALLTAVSGLGGRTVGRCTNAGMHRLFCRQDADCDTQAGKGDGRCPPLSIIFDAPLTATDACTTLVDTKVPLKRIRGQLRTTTQTLQIKTTPSAGLVTTSSFSLVCQPMQ